ncbi:MAG: prenyltransferase/squalene oxidase repeat-containing protein [Anaerolineaceae bacterium]
MMTNTPEYPKQKTDPELVRWLLDSDPAIRWQVKQDLLGASQDEVAAERAHVAYEGLGKQLLNLQGADGYWAGEAWNQGWNSTYHALTLLREMGLDPTSGKAQIAIDKVREKVKWRGWDWDGNWLGWEVMGNPFFAGEVEPCINGLVGAAGAYFGQDIERIIAWLLKGQLEDGGWNCEAENGSIRSSFNSTICVLEGLLEYETFSDDSAKVRDARVLGEEYLLERQLFHRLSTGEVLERDRWGQTAFTRFGFPNWWHYDVLRGLDYLRKAGVTPDERMEKAIELVGSRRVADGYWLNEVNYPGDMPIEIDAGEGQPSKWNTLRALRVLNWYFEGRE